MIFVGTLLLVVFLKGVLEEEDIFKPIYLVLDNDGLIVGGVVRDEGGGEGGSLS